MKLLNNIVRFRKDEDGAVTVDWVVLTAAIVAVSVGLFITLGPALIGVAGDITDAIETQNALSGG